MTDLTDKEIDRRAFVAQSLAIGAGLAVPAACAEPPKTGEATVRQAGDAAPANTPLSAGVQANDELFELTVAEARARMEKGALTSHDLTQRYLSRIDAMDKTDRPLFEEDMVVALGNLF